MYRPEQALVQFRQCEVAELKMPELRKNLFRPTR